MTSPDAPRREWGWVIGLSVGIVALVNAPYLLAYFAPPPGPYVFSGLLFNPADGNSYFAKMREGWRGEWLFTLPYTTDPGPGAFLFTYYLFLGHAARWTGAGIELTYHLTRVAGGLALLLSAYHFIARFYDSFRVRLTLWLFFGFSSGLGWLALPFAERLATLSPGVTADFWVAESIPFLSLFSNAHFALALALMLWIFEWTLPGLAPATVSISRLIATALAATALTQLQPMALLPVGAVLSVLVLWRSIDRRALVRAEWLPLAVVGVFSAPWLVYDYWAVASHPQLSVWNAQNLTPSPPVWEALIWGGAPLLLAGAGLLAALRRRRPLDDVLIVWLVANALLLYAPFSLQRRLSLGIWMPITLLAGRGVRDVVWPVVGARWRPAVLAMVAALSLTTNFVIYAASLGAQRNPDPKQGLFVTRDEAAALQWMAENVRPGEVVLAGPVMGMLTPARTDARVIYGHPFETVQAETRKRAVEDFYAGRLTPQDFLARYPVDYVFYGPTEKIYGPLPGLPGWRVVFQQGEVTLYAR